jgi:hypothetical protein
VGIARERSVARWSEDGRSILVESVRCFDKNGETADFKLTEIWKLIDNEKCISVEVNLNSIEGKQTMILVYDRQKASDYRF